MSNFAQKIEIISRKEAAHTVQKTHWRAQHEVRMREDQLDKGEDKVMFVSRAAERDKQFVLNLVSYFDTSLAYRESKLIRAVQHSAALVQKQSSVSY